MKKRILSLLVGLAVLPASTQVPPTSPSQRALDEYAVVTGRTLLQYGGLPRLSDSLAGRMGADTNGAAALFEQELAGKGIGVERLGDLFARIMPWSWTNDAAIMGQMGRLKLPSARPTHPQTGEINFPGVDLEQCLDIYSELRKRAIIRPYLLPRARIQFNTQKGLTHDEMVYALDTVFALNGVAMVEDGESMVQVVPIAAASSVKVRAPRREPGAVLINPKTVPGSPPHVYPPQPAPWPNRVMTAGEFAPYYAQLAGVELIPPDASIGGPISFHAGIPLTKAELLYAIETTLALDGLAIQTNDGRAIRLVAVSGQHKWGKK